METTIKRQLASRVAHNLSLLQEDALVGLMFDDFESTDGTSLDYDKVKEHAVSIQTDAEICIAFDMDPIEETEAWVPTDDWITHMCHAFTDARRAEAKKKAQTAFGGPRDEYNAKNPHSKRGPSNSTRHASPAPRAMVAKASRLAAGRTAAAAAKSKVPPRKAPPTAPTPRTVSSSVPTVYGMGKPSAPAPPLAASHMPIAEGAAEPMRSAERASHGLETGGEPSNGKSGFGGGWIW